MTDDTHIVFENEIDEAIKRAGHILDLADLADGLSEEDLSYVYEDRFHCGVCTTRVVMETVWPSVERYIDALKARIMELKNFPHE